MTSRNHTPAAHVTRRAWHDGACTTTKRPGRCVNTVTPGLTPAKEGLGVSLPVTPCATHTYSVRHATTRDHAGAVAR